MATAEPNDPPDSLICQVCKEFLTQTPYTLRCLHNFCPVCIEKIPRVTEKEKIGVRCPICSQFCKNSGIKANSTFLSIVREFTRLYSERMLNRLNVGNRCRSCKQKEATAFCTDCQFDLCDVCKLTHLELKGCSNHHIVIPGEEHVPLVIPKICPSHPSKAITVHCKPCQKAICTDCKLASHDTHPSESIDDALSTVIPKVKAKFQQIEKKCAQLESVRTDVENKTEEATANLRELKHQLEEEYNRKIEKIKCEYQKLTDQLFTQPIIKEGMIIQTDLDNSVSSMKSIVNYGNTLIDSSQGPGILFELQNELQGRIEAFAEENPDTKEAEDYIRSKITIATFIPAEETCNNMIGTIKFQHLIEQPTQVNPSGIGVARPKSHEYDNSASSQANTETISTAHIVKSFRSVDIDLNTLKLEKPIKQIQIRNRFDRFCYFSDCIWAACGSYGTNHCIDIYSKNGAFIRSILLSTHGKELNPRAIHPLSTDHMLVATDSGLYSMAVTRGQLGGQIMKGNIQDVHVQGENIAVLVCEESNKFNSVYLLQSGPPHTVTSHFRLGHAKAGTVLLHGQSVLLSAGYGYTKKYTHITRYSLQGDKLSQHGSFGHEEPGELFEPRMCMCDSRGSILVIDMGNNRLQLLDTDHHWSVIKGVDVVCPTDVIIVGQHLYVKHDNGLTIYKM